MGEISPEEREALKQRSDGIGRRLDDVKARQAAGRQSDGRSGPNGQGAAYGQAFKIAAELIAGLVFGGALGWFLDKQFGTLPIFLVVFVVLGLSAGMMNVIRGARRAQALAEPLQRASPSIKDGDDNET